MHRGTVPLCTPVHVPIFSFSFLCSVALPFHRSDDKEGSRSVAERFVVVTRTKPSSAHVQRSLVTFPVANIVTLLVFFLPFFRPFSPFMRQIFGGRKSVSQKSGSCRIHFRQKSENLLERGKNRYNFAVSTENLLERGKNRYNFAVSSAQGDCPPVHAPYPPLSANFTHTLIVELDMPYLTESWYKVKLLSLYSRTILHFSSYDNLFFLWP